MKTTSVDFFRVLRDEAEKDKRTAEYYPGTIMDRALCYLDYGAMATLLSECHEYYQGASFNIEADGDNLMEVVTAEAMFAVLEAFDACSEKPSAGRWQWDAENYENMLDFLANGEAF